jgi:hypothetical protein
LDYFGTLSKKELNYLRKADEEETDTYIIRGFLPFDAPGTLAAIFQDLARTCFKSGKRVVLPVPDQYRALAKGIGLRQIPGIFLFLDQRHPLYELDLRQFGIELWFEWLIMGRVLPHWLNSLLLYSKKVWQEHVNSALDNLNNIPFLDRHLLAPLAEETQNTTEKNCHSGGEFLQALITEIIYQFRTGENTSLTGGKSDRKIGELLSVTFLRAHQREKAADLLGLPSTTYYRRLKQARSRLTEVLFIKAVELAEKNYLKNR